MRSYEIEKVSSWYASEGVAQVPLLLLLSEPSRCVYADLRSSHRLLLRLRTPFVHASSWLH